MKLHTPLPFVQIFSHRKKKASLILASTKETSSIILSPWWHRPMVGLNVGANSRQHFAACIRNICLRNPCLSLQHAKQPSLLTHKYSTHILYPMCEPFILGKFIFSWYCKSLSRPTFDTKAVIAFYTLFTSLVSLQRLWKRWRTSLV